MARRVDDQITDLANLLPKLQKVLLEERLNIHTPKHKQMDGTPEETKQVVRYGAIEGGGTTFVVSVAEKEPTNVVFQTSIDTTTPADTLEAACKVLQENGPVDAIGFGCFGPIDLNTRSKTYGYVTSTPKTIWKYTDVLSPVHKLGVPTMFHTDVNAAAMGESQYGNHGDNVENCVYVTVGTGIGVGVVVNGRPISGMVHPEGGHIRVIRHADDTYKGNCPYHADCLEGLANSKAIADRLNIEPSALKNVGDDNRVWDIVAYYYAQLCNSMLMMLSPHVMVLGGGVFKRVSLFPKIRAQFKELVGGYINAEEIEKLDSYIVPSRFNSQDSNTTAGAVGCLVMAKTALEQAGSQSRL